MSTHEKVTQQELEVLFEAWAVYQKGLRLDPPKVLSIEPKPEALPAFHVCAERGWLERSFHNNGATMTFKWGQRADAALDIGALLETARESVN